jgi:uncharacterized membrane protein YeaQ/YmgE (transglycosylase-associated protein family)
MAYVILVGFVAGMGARLLARGRSRPLGYVVTIVLGIAGALLATFIGQAIGWYRPDQGAGFLAAAAGAVIVLFAWNHFLAGRA